MTEWCLVLLFAFPVILIDEVLKFVGELSAASELCSRSQLYFKCPILNAGRRIETRSEVHRNYSE